MPPKAKASPKGEAAPRTRLSTKSAPERPLSAAQRAKDASADGAVAIAKKDMSNFLGVKGYRGKRTDPVVKTNAFKTMEIYNKLPDGKKREFVAQLPRGVARTRTMIGFPTTRRR